MSLKNKIIGILGAVMFVALIVFLPRTSATDKWENVRIEHCADLFAYYSKCIESRDETSKSCKKYDEMDALYVTRYQGEPFESCDPFSYGEVTP